MFGRSKRKDAPGQTGNGRGTEPLVTAATEPVLPPPPPPLAPPITSELPPPPPPVAVADLAPPAPPPPAPAPPVPAADPAPPADALSQADIRARTLLADSIARMELQLSQPESAAPPAVQPTAAPVPVSGNGVIEALAGSVAKTASEVARALEQMSGMCAMLAERLDADREERRVLTEAIARLGVGTNGAVTTDAPSSVLGGTIFAPPPVAPDDNVISIVDEPRAIQADPSPSVSMFAAPPVAREREAVFLGDDDSEEVIAAPSKSFFAAPPVARDEISIVTEDEISIVTDDELVASASAEPVGAGMWCRDDDQWIGGVEIADFVSDNGTIRYWLRRTSDGRMLPRPFDATDLRFVRETTRAD